MASTTFVDNTTVIQADWCNDVNSSVYNILGNGTTVPANAAAARTNLGLGTIATQAASAVAITGGSVTGITDLAVADGGTGASTAANARTNLGAAASGAATASGLTMATSRLLGRTTASTGAIEEISVGSGLTLSGGSLSATASVFTGYFQSSDQTITASGGLTIPHGLSAKPTLVIYLLKCTTAEGNYSVGDEVMVTINDRTGQGVSIWPDATNINVRYYSNASTFSIVNKTTGGTFDITNANWRLVVRAWV